jgi:dTDP-glucose 4,6-dehydratase
MVRAVCAILDELLPKSPNCPHEKLIHFVQDRPGHDWRYAIDPLKLRSDLGWRPSRSFEESLRLTVAWYLENAEWCARALQRGDGVVLPPRLGIDQRPSSAASLA